nr:tetratricopeptide repeat protein [uncultured Blautia sp.]
MELKDAKCPNCGGQLKLNPNLEKGTCIYCGTEIVVSEAIQKYKVEVDGIATTKSSMIHAFNQLEDGDFDGAMKAFKHVIETDPTNAEAYYGMFRCSLVIADYYKTKNSGMQRAIPQYYEDLSEAVTKYGRRAVQYADEPEKTQYSSEVNHIVDDIQSYADNQQNNSSKGGCYVATAVYGSYDCPEVWTLRRYRDDTLAGTWYGRLFIKTYYAVSPTIVKLFGNTEWFKKMWRGKLDAMVENLQRKGIESTPYEDKNW